MAQAPAPVQGQGQGIYTCVDAKGRRLTADRPIVECIDREQRELYPSGTVKRKVGPSLTAEERAADEEKERKLADERFRVAEEKRRERALLVRYPDKASHDKEREIALAQVDDVLVAANQRTVDLMVQRKTLASEAEFYLTDPSKMPVRLRRLIEENEQQQVAQKRFAGDQVLERQRVNARFDEELVKLRLLWAQLARPATAAAAASAPLKK